MVRVIRRYLQGFLFIALVTAISLCTAAQPQLPGQRLAPENIQKLKLSATNEVRQTYDVSMIGDRITVRGAEFFVGLFALNNTPELWLFQNIRDKAVIEGDMVMGPFDAVMEQQQAIKAALTSPAFALTSLPGSFERWPSRTIPFTFQGDLVNHEIPTEIRQPIIDAMAHIEERTPLRFREKNDSDESWIQFARQWDTSFCPRSSANFGRRNGASVVHIQLTDCSKRTECEGDDPPDDLDCSNFFDQSGLLKRSAIHEIGHTLGFKHEQSRSDRDDYIELDMECIESTFLSWWISKFGNYNTAGTGFETIGPYDFESIMHYPTDMRTVDGEDCFTVVKKSEHRDEGDDLGIIRQSTQLSKHDINALYHMYRRNTQTNDTNERFGGVMIAQDFDKDGYDDLAVSATTHRAPGNGPSSGAAFLFKGTATGYVYWKRIDPPDPQNSQRFGHSLAAADFDLDGTIDLAIGAPGTSVGGKADAGAVFIYSIHRNLGAPLVRTLTSPRTPEVGDLFGSSLATGRFYSITLFPGEEQRERQRRHLAIGAPGARAPGVNWRPGYVWYWNAAQPDIFGWPTIDMSDIAWAGRFGATITALRVGDDAWMNETTNQHVITPLLVSSRFDNGIDCAKAALIVLDRSPGGGLEIVNTGHITDPDAVPVSASLCGTNRTDPLATDEVAVAVDRGFGRSIAVGDFNKDGRIDIAIGDPEAGATSTDAGPGMVYLFTQSTPNQTANFDFLGRVDQAAFGGNEPGDAFGVALSAADYDGDGFTDLAVGAAGEDIGSASNAGSVFFFRGCERRFGPLVTLDSINDALITGHLPEISNQRQACVGGLRAWQMLDQPGDSDETNDFFGQILTTVDTDADGDLDVAVGTPGEAPGSDSNSGYVYFIQSDGGNDADNFRTRSGFSQELQSPFF